MLINFGEMLKPSIPRAENLLRPVIVHVFLVVSVLAVIVTVAVPTVTIHPFRPQTASGFAWSYALKRIEPMLTSVGLTLVLAWAVLLCAGARRWWRRGMIVLLVAVTGGATWFARHHFEWMFNPLAGINNRNFIMQDEQIGS